MGKVVGISDGDTIRLLVENGQQKITHKIRLAQIDTPESSQPLGQKAKQTNTGSIRRQSNWYICSSGRAINQTTREQAPRETVNRPTSIPSTSGSCGSKSKCSQMSSCEEAKFYLSQCGLRKLDRDNDGVPCETLCK